MNGMKTITRDTFLVMFRCNGKNKIRELKALGYTDEDLATVESFWKVQRDCLECRTKDRQIEELHKQIEKLQCNREYFDRKFSEINKEDKL